MKFIPFKLEEFWKKYEFSAPYLMCCSDVESWTQEEILRFADRETKKLWNELRLCYTESPGFPLLREEIATLYSSIKAAQIVTFAGGEEGIYCAFKALLNPGDHVIVVTPCYQSLESLPSLMGADVTKIKLNPQEGWKLQLSQVENALRPSTKLIVINYPHNPTGTLLDQEVFNGMVALAKKNGTYIFSDEMYWLLENDEMQRLPSIADVYEKGIALFGMTKPFGLGGLRIGWLASHDEEFLQKANAYKLYTSISNSAPSEILALIALKAKNKILDRNRKLLHRHLTLLDQFFGRHSKSLSWTRPAAGTIAFPELLLPVSIDQFMEDLLKKTGVLIMPGSVYDFSGNFFRIGYGRKDFPEILNRFEGFLNGYETIYETAD